MEINQMQLNEEPEDSMVSHYVPAGTLIYINGIPAYVPQETKIRTNPANIPLMFAQSEAET